LRRYIAILLLAGAALGGCGGSTTKTVTAAAPPPTAAATTPSRTATPPPPSGSAAASRAGVVDGHPVTLEIVGARRSGLTTVLSLRLTTTDSGIAQVASTFDDGIFQKSRSPDASSVSGGDTLDGVYLIDSVNAKKYLVARDSQNNCVCSSNLGSSFVRSSGPLLLSATFAAPPPTVKMLDVFVPTFGTFKDVPLG